MEFKKKEDFLKQFLSVKEAAQLWEVSPRQVQIYCKQGILDGAFKVGKVWVIPADCQKPVYKFVSGKADEKIKSDENA